MKVKDDLYYKKRYDMIAEHIIPRDIRDKNVLRAMERVPRHIFVSKCMVNYAYNDRPLPIGYGQTISQPYMVAIMTQLLELDDNKRVLEIGTGSGYQTAILAEICKEVYSIERIPELSEIAKGNLSRLGYKNVKLKVADGSIGWAEYSPFNGIIVTAASPEVPEVLKLQLNEDNGILVIPVGDRFSQSLKRIIRKKDKFYEEDLLLCAFVPLIGKHGWKY